MDACRLERLLGGCVPLMYEEETGSTNDDAKALAVVGKAPVLVVSGRQTAGRGRRGNSFISPEGGIYMSLAVPACNDTIKFLTSFVGVCVCEVLEEICGLKAGIKWVNDIYLDGRKLAGILVELVSEYVVIGIGVNGTVTPEMLDGVKATSIGEYVIRPDLEAVCAGVCAALVHGIERGIDGKSTMAACRQRSVLLGREVSFEEEGKPCRGKVDDIGDDGSLIVCSGSVIRALSTTACNVRLIEGLADQMAGEFVPLRYSRTDS